MTPPSELPIIPEAPMQTAVDVSKVATMNEEVTAKPVRRVFPIMVGMSYELEKVVQAVRAGGSHFLVCSIPWAMIEPHGKQAESNHGQTLERLASRGGLSACEAVAILEDRRWRKMEFGNAILAAKVTLWFEGQIAALSGTKDESHE